jgi:hypothetical protein
MSKLFDYLDKAVYERYARSLADTNFRNEFKAPLSDCDATLLQNGKKLTEWHVADIDRRIVLGAEPSQAPFLTRHYLGEAIDVLREIPSKWAQTAMDASMQDLFEIAPKYVGLAQDIAELGFYCAGKEIDQLQSYWLEFMYDVWYYQHLLRTQSVAHASDLKQYASGELAYVDHHNYRSAARDIALLCADNLIEFLTKARDDLSGCSSE